MQSTSTPKESALISSSNKLLGKKLFVADQISCTGSRVYVERYAEFIRRQGASNTKKAGEADILLVDTCAYSKEQESRSINLIKEHETAAKDGAKVIVCGCLAGINPQKLQEHYHGEFFSPKNEKHLAYILNLDEEETQFITMSDPRGRFMGGDFKGTSKVMNFALRFLQTLHHVDAKLSLKKLPGVSKLLAASQAANPHAYAVTISQGCLGHCSFCVIPMAKGRTTSLPMGLIIEKIAWAVKSGAKKIILTSEDTGAYGSDIGTNFVDLLTKIHELPMDFELYINFFDPRWLRKYADGISNILKLGKIRYIQFPIQSGSDSVLHRMRRLYRTQHVIPFLQEIKRTMPSLTLSTQVIVGFPGETEQEFNETRRAIKTGIFDHLDIFKFSNRAGADAEKLPDHLPAETINARAKILRQDWLLTSALRTVKLLKARDWNLALPQMPSSQSESPS